MKEQIMAVAIPLFARFGYRKTTLDDIARALHMAKGNIYHYFTNKEGFYHQTVASVLNTWRLYVQEQVSTVPDPVDRFRRMAETAIAYPESNPNFCNILLQDPHIFLLSNRFDSYRPVNQPAEALLHSVIEQGIRIGIFRDVSTEYTTELIFSIYMMHLIKIYGQGDGARGKEMYRSCVELLLNGLCK